jgi:hypothetical protein
MGASVTTATRAYIKPESINPDEAMRNFCQRNPVFIFFSFQNSLKFAINMFAVSMQIFSLLPTQREQSEGRSDP